jgi:hypothetical protein
MFQANTIIADIPDIMASVCTREDSIKGEDPEDSGSTVMDLANFLSSELTMTLQTSAPKTEKREPEVERSFAVRRQARLNPKDPMIALSRRSSIELSSFADSCSSIETVRISNKQDWDKESVGSDGKTGAFDLKSLEDLTALMAIPLRGSLTSMHRRSQGNMAA